MQQRYDRRTFLGKSVRATAGFAVLGGAGALLEACASSSGVAAYHAQPNAGVGVGKPVMGGHLVMGTEAEEDSIDPTAGHFDSTGVMYARTVYDPLAMVLADGTVVPYLAESIVPNASYTQWTITLRPNLRFHDGTPCDGEAMLFCMQAFLKSFLTGISMTYVKSVAQTGPLSVTFTMHDPWVPFPAWLAGYIGGQIAYMFSPTAYEKYGNNFGSHPVGTGPFVFEEWVPNDHFTSTKNPNYWRTDRYGNRLPYLDAMTFKPIIDVTTRLDALLAGEIDIMHTDDDPTIAQVRAHADTLVDVEDDKLTVGEPDMNFGMVNCQDPLLSDVRLRRALALAFNQPQYIATVGEGIITPATGPFPKPSPYYGPTGWPSYDLAAAKALVQSWMRDHGGQAPKVVYTTTSAPSAMTSAAVVQSFLQAAGFDASVKQAEQAAFIDDAVFGKYQLFSWRQFANVDPDLNYIWWAADTVGTEISLNFARNKDMIIQNALDRARQSASPAVRLEAYQTVAQRFAVDFPYIWSNRDVWSVSARKNVQNFNNPTSPAGERGLGMLSGIIWPTEIWKTA